MPNSPPNLKVQLSAYRMTAWWHCSQKRAKCEPNREACLSCKESLAFCSHCHCSPSPQVKGTDAQAVRAVQVHEHCSSLNSADCFVLQRPGAIIVWKGSKSSPVM